MNKTVFTDETGIVERVLADEVEGGDVVDGSTSVAPGWRLENGAYVPPPLLLGNDAPISERDIDDHATFKISKLLNLSSEQTVDRAILDGLREMLRLQQVRDGVLNADGLGYFVEPAALGAEQVVRVQQLLWFNDQIDKIYASAKGLKRLLRDEGATSFPADFKDEIYWR